MIPSSYLPRSAPTKPKKPKPKTDFVVKDETRQLPSPTKISKKAEKALVTRFGEKAELIIDQLEFGVSDGVQSLITRSLLQSLVEVLPIAEKEVRDTGAKRGIYQFNQTIGSIRELLADVQASQDRGMLGQSIVEKTVRPAFLDISVQIVTALAEIEAFGKNNLDKTTRREFVSLIDSLKRNLATYISTQYREVSNTVVQSLS